MCQVNPLGHGLTRWVRENRENRPRRLEWYAGDIAQARGLIDTFSTGSFILEFPKSDSQPQVTSDAPVNAGEKG